MKLLKKLFGLDKKVPVTAVEKDPEINFNPVAPKEITTIAPALTPIEQGEKAIAILKAKEESTQPAKVAPVKTSTPKKKPVKKAPVKK